MEQNYVTVILCIYDTLILTILHYITLHTLLLSLEFGSSSYVMTAIRAFSVYRS